MMMIRFKYGLGADGPVVRQVQLQGCRWDVVVSEQRLTVTDHQEVLFGGKTQGVAATPFPCAFILAGFAGKEPS